MVGARPIACDQAGARGWCVEALVDGARLRRQGSLLIDATGRCASPARRIGGRRIVYDRLVGLVGLVPPRANSGSRDARTLVEAVASGWWYSAPLPDGRRIAAFMTDGDLIPRNAAARTAFWKTQLELARHTKAAIGLGTRDGRPRVVPAGSSQRARGSGPWWLAVGDAAASFDPLSQQGVMWALESGLEAARAIDALFRGDPGALDRYGRMGRSRVRRLSRSSPGVLRP